ncbi:hypothetical protein LCGC14_0793950 [marine sediment metagenome]|uniref:Uncharacterized protein n=1 Tax=marine sediment metagenome TaxID=412755 RepID=A0A0F9PW22_9ZZZZ
MNLTFCKKITLKSKRKRIFDLDLEIYFTFLRLSTLYVVDYKPDLTYNNFLRDSYVNSVPQLAGYGLTMEEIADVNLQCIMFNDGAAWIFDPNDVLAPIDAFMLASDSSWVAPWTEFSNLVEYKKQFWALFLHREF